MLLVTASYVSELSNDGREEAEVVETTASAKAERTALAREFVTSPGQSFFTNASFARGWIDRQMVLAVKDAFADQQISDQTAEKIAEALLSDPQRARQLVDEKRIQAAPDFLNKKTLETMIRYMGSKEDGQLWAKATGIAYEAQQIVAAGGTQTDAQEVMRNSFSLQETVRLTDIRAALNAYQDEDVYDAWESAAYKAMIVEIIKTDADVATRIAELVKG